METEHAFMPDPGARGMNPLLVLALREHGILGYDPAPEPVAPPLQQVLGLVGHVPAPEPTGTPLRQVLGLDPI